MTYERSSPALEAGPSYTHLFEGLPSNNLLLQANAPRYTILAATHHYLDHLGMKKEELVGKDLFEVFPSNVNDATDTGEADLRASLEQVLTGHKPHLLAVQRYDVADENGHYLERYWKAEN